MSLFSQPITDITDKPITPERLEQVLNEAELHEQVTEFELAPDIYRLNEDFQYTTSLKQLVDDRITVGQLICLTPEPPIMRQLINTNLPIIMNWLEDKRSIKFTAGQIQGAEAQLEQVEQQLRRQLAPHVLKRYLKHYLLMGVGVIVCGMNDEPLGPRTPKDIMLDYTNHNLVAVSGRSRLRCCSRFGEEAVMAGDDEPVEVIYGNLGVEGQWSEFILHQGQVQAAPLSRPTIHYNIFEGDPETGRPAGLFRLLIALERDKINIDNAVTSRIKMAERASLFIGGNAMTPDELRSMYDKGIVPLQTDGVTRLTDNLAWAPSRIEEKSCWTGGRSSSFRKQPRLRGCAGLR